VVARALPPDCNQGNTHTQLRAQKLPPRQALDSHRAEQKGVTVHTLAEGKNLTELLETIPAFSSCGRDTLQDFVDHDVVKVHCPAGKKLNPLTAEEQNLYVLASGSALLTDGNDVVVELEPGDYFGRSPGRQHHIVASVIALSDVEILVINPREVARLQQPTLEDWSRLSKGDWTIDLPDAAPRSNRRNRCHAALAV
jgi:CRP-like cAMP-binding protein